MPMAEATLLHGDVDLTNCDREPIHIPGAILPHGAMLVLDPETMQVQQAAGDLPGLLGSTIEVVVGKSASTIFNSDQIDQLRAVASTSKLSKPRHLLDPLFRITPNCPLDASLHRSDGALVLEFEAADPGARYAADPLAAVQEMVEGFDGVGSLHALCQLAAERVRKVAGYDRVLVYRFMQDESG